MAEQYLRKVALEIVDSSTGLTTVIDNLRIQFTIKKTPKSEPNKSEIIVYNLSEKTRSLVEAKNCKVILSAGYLGLNLQGILNSNLFSSKSVDTIFKGDVKKFEHKKETVDILTKLECGDGHVAFTSSVFDKGYPSDTSLNIAFKDLAAALGLSKGAQIDIPSTKIGNGITFSGPVRDHLDNLCRRYNLEWSIQDESLQIVQSGGATNDDEVFLNKDTGLVGSPAKTKDGVEFQCLLQPVIKPGKKIKLESMFINGSFVSRNVVHDGDSHQGKFLTKVECKTNG